jgi:hypothetical protein
MLGHPLLSHDGHAGVLVVVHVDQIDAAASDADPESGGGGAHMRVNLRGSRESMPGNEPSSPSTVSKDGRTVDAC